MLVVTEINAFLRFDRPFCWQMKSQPLRNKLLKQPVHVDDLANAIWAASSEPAAIGEAINVPGPEPLSFSEVIDTAASALGRSVRVVGIPTRPLRAGVSLQERLFSTPRLKAEQIDRLVEDKTFAVGPASRILNHSPRSFAQGIGDEVTLLTTQHRTSVRDR